MKRINIINNTRNPKTFWKLIFRPRKRKVKKCPIKKDEWNGFLINAHPKTKKIPKIDASDEFIEILDKKITMDELKSSLKRLKNKKTPGHDEISNEFSKELPEC